MSSIPKIIHYCWFGGNTLPESAIKCINSWRKFFPDYEIKEWNEDNFDVNIIPYTAEAYSVKKYAFVSDYARFWILYKYGGLYFDTDVEVVKNMDDIVERGPFMGIEVEAKSKNLPAINPGLGLGVESKHPIYKAILDYYQKLHYFDENGKPNNITVVKHNTKVLKENGLQPTNKLQEVGGIWIYPKDYFNPLDDLTGRLIKTHNTRTIHRYTRTWSDTPNWRVCLSRFSHRIFGMKLHRLKVFFRKKL